MQLTLIWPEPNARLLFQHKPFHFMHLSKTLFTSKVVQALLALLALSCTSLFAQSTPKVDNPHVKISTNLGDVVLELYPDKAPKTVANFLQYVKDRHYDGTIFHRVIDGFMIQGGGFDPDMTQKSTNDPIDNEAENGLKNDRYTIAMARTSDPHSATAQFFINVGDNDFLNYPGSDGWGYAVFGKVSDGEDVVDAIRAVKTGRKSMFSDVPVETVVIEKAEVV